MIAVERRDWIVDVHDYVMQVGILQQLSEKEGERNRSLFTFAQVARYALVSHQYEAVPPLFGPHLNVDSLRAKKFSNPFVDFLIIRCDENHSEAMNVTLFSSLGKACFSQKMKFMEGENRLNLPGDLPSGVHFLVLENEAGRWILKVAK